MLVGKTEYISLGEKTALLSMSLDFVRQCFSNCDSWIRNIYQHYLGTVISADSQAPFRPTESETLMGKPSHLSLTGLPGDWESLRTTAGR